MANVKACPLMVLAGTIAVGASQGSVGLPDTGQSCAVLTLAKQLRGQR